MFTDQFTINIYLQEPSIYMYTQKVLYELTLGGYSGESDSVWTEVCRFSL